MLKIHYPRGMIRVYYNSSFGELTNQGVCNEAAVSLFPIFFLTQKSMTKNLILDDKSHPHY